MIFFIEHCGVTCDFRILYHRWLQPLFAPWRIKSTLSNNEEIFPIKWYDWYGAYQMPISVRVVFEYITSYMLTSSVRVVFEYITSYMLTSSVVSLWLTYKAKKVMFCFKALQGFKNGCGMRFFLCCCFWGFFCMTFFFFFIWQGKQPRTGWG